MKAVQAVTEIKRAVSIPVITVGRYTEPHFADLLVKQGRTDLVAFGRQSLADPHMPKKAMEDKLDDMIPCIACLQGCVANMFKGEPIRCLTNPIQGFESEEVFDAKDQKKVMVIGGGVGGMCAAFLCAERGHDVTVIEFRDTVGADVIPEHRKYLMKDFEEFGIDEITSAKVCKFFEDGVVYETPDGNKHEARGFDSVVLSMGFRNYNPFAEELEKTGKEVYVLGDAIKARRAIDATREAYDIAVQI